MDNSKGIAIIRNRLASHPVSAEFRKLNPDIYPNENHPHGKLSDAKPKHHKAPALGKAGRGEKESLSRTRIRFVGYRVRPLDPDNFAGSVKDLLDGLRHAGIISGDEPWKITLETEQVKVDTFREEKTVIEIED